jgi:UDP-2,3-diacylglucosamine hydrolase
MPTKIIDKLCIIAGTGSLPKIIANKYNNTFILGIEGTTEQSFVESYDHAWIKLGEIGKAIDLMKENKITHVVIAGALKKPDLKSLKLDNTGAKLLASLTKNKLFGDDSLLTTIINFIEKNGFIVVGVEEIIEGITAKGLLTKTKPDENARNDIDIGVRLLNTIGDFDVGQAIIVSNGVVIGIEGIEGTDVLINKYKDYSLTRNGVLIKIPKPNQSKKADMPTIGIQTLENIIQANLAGIAIKEHETIILDKDLLIKRANEANKFIIAI